MKINRIYLNNYRNFKNVQIEPGQKLNLILGDNAQGKTNIVEAIYVSALLKSFRTKLNSNLIKHGEKSATINIDILKSKVDFSIKLNIEKNSKKYTINGKIPNTKSIFNYINVVIFHPEETNFILSNPLYRRNLIDRSIFYTDYNYINIYKNYNRVLKQRNAYLKNSNNEIDCWKDQLIKYGSKIVVNRISYIEKINKFLSDKNFLRVNNEHYQLEYTRKTSREKIQEQLAEEFDRNKVREKHLGYTLAGPHKDDIDFYLNMQPANGFASQGQKRSMAISFKSAQILDYKAVHNESPILILDDMTSELDAKRKNLLLENLIENSGQVFITSTGFKQIKKSQTMRIFKVEHDEISHVN